MDEYSDSEVISVRAPSEDLNPPPDDGKPGKSWCYTFNNPTQEEMNQLALMTEVTRHRCCFEVGVEGTPHLQGIIVFPKSYRFAALKKLWPRAYIAKCKSVEHSWNYCTKGQMMLDIDKRVQGKRSDLEQIFEMVQAGAPLHQMIKAHPATYMRSRQGILATRADLIPPRQHETEVHIRWGPSGTGKTRYVWDMYGPDLVYEKGPGKWWDGYTGQGIVLIDDFDPETDYDIPWEMWLKLTDRYPLKIEFKGGMCQFNSKKIYITSNFSPTRWFTKHENKKAFLRRVTTITRLDGRSQCVTDGFGEPIVTVVTESETEVA